MVLLLFFCGGESVFRGQERPVVFLNGAETTLNPTVSNNKAISEYCIHADHNVQKS